MRALQVLGEAGRSGRRTQLSHHGHLLLTVHRAFTVKVVHLKQRTDNLFILRKASHSVEGRTKYSSPCLPEDRLLF